LDSGTQRKARGILFTAALLIGAQVLAAQPSPTPDHAGQGWTQTSAPLSGLASPASSIGERLIRFNGRALDAAGKPVADVAGVTFAIYEEQSGGAALWQETQNLATGADGRFSALLGATSATGIPPELFASGESRWLGVLTHGPEASEQPRVLLVSVPYALRSADSEMLGGKPASAYMTLNAQTTNAGGCLETGTATSASASATSAKSAAKATPALTASSAKAGFLPVFTDTSGDLSDSLISQANGFVGIGTAAPAAALDVVGANPTLRIDNYSNVVGDSPNFNFLSARGTSAAPGASQSGDNLGQFASAGYSGSSFPGSKVKVSFIATENWTAAANGTAMTFATTANGTTARSERLRIDNTGNVGIGTTTPSHTLSFGGSQANTVGVEANPTAGSAGNNLSISAGAAALGATNQAGGDLVLAAGKGTGAGAGGNVHLQAAGDASSGTSPDTISDRLLIAGKPKAMTGTVPTANLFSLQIAPGEAAGGRVKFTIVASDGTNYVAETGEFIYLATPKQVQCAVVLSEIFTTPPAWTNNALGISSSPAYPGAIGQIGSLNAQCDTYYPGINSNPIFQISDTEPTWFTPTTHKVYYTIENQSQAVINLQP
jgi:hypothetical protein